LLVLRRSRDRLAQSKRFTGPNAIHSTLMRLRHSDPAATRGTAPAFNKIGPSTPWCWRIVLGPLLRADQVKAARCPRYVVARSRAQVAATSRSLKSARASAPGFHGGSKLGKPRPRSAFDFLSWAQVLSLLVQHPLSSKHTRDGETFTGDIWAGAANEEVLRRRPSAQ
jgi:hypothetical protein